ncbi:site-specific DNA-methyltransferase [Pseudoalteromonas sp. 1181_04]|uniref:site-specific DNA-methyltransferase n=1 Tax=Pseudoalteromonas sp. 1181_04 TaxID=2604450 RepID=UPI0040644237
MEQKNIILASIENIDDKVGGVLVSSDNYQALTLLGRKYKDKVNTVYIDPPYNTDAGPILYKNGFRDSSWISLMESRLELGKKMLSKKGILCCTIDDYELYNLAKLMEEVFEEIAGTVAIRIKPSGRPIPNGFALAHEYALFARKDENTPIERLDRTAEQLARYRDSDDNGPYFWEMLRKAGGGASQKDRPTMCYPFLLSENESISLAKCSYNTQTELYENVAIPQEGETLVWPERDDNSMGRWYLSRDRVANMLSELKAVKQDNGKYFIYYRRRPNEGVQPLSFWADAKYSATEHGTALIKKLFGNSSVFSYPKSIHAVEDCLKVGGAKEKDSIVLDYFAGAGTTGHAVINLNRSDKGSRKFILVEQGEYFNKVTKPRILKNSYSSQWINGKAQDKDSISIILKTVVLESYEDTLNNLELKKHQQTSDLFEMMNEETKSDYLLNYMLETESKGSLLSTDDFKKPFDYKMKIAVDSAGASEEQNVDLVETFNYLIGLHVNTIESNLEKGYVRIEGTLPSGERALVLWRDCEKIQYDDFTKFANRFDLFAKQKTFDVIYVNGDHNLPTAFTNDEDDVTRTLKLRQIEPEFLEQMFAPDELA